MHNMKYTAELKSEAVKQINVIEYARRYGLGG